MAKTPPRLTRLLIEAMAKHLPPSASRLRLLDFDGQAGAILSELRADVEVQPVEGAVDRWMPDVVDTVDSVVAFGALPDADVLVSALRAMRPGGRLIVVDPDREPEEAFVKTLEAAGFTRILVETAAECPLPTGVLLRGEKPHTTPDTLERVQQVAAQDGDLLDLAAYNGRYVHLLVQETPNKPVWARAADEVVQWHAAAMQRSDGSPLTLLAFSSLPKAVAFMQPAVLNGRVNGINKVAKFSVETAGTWTLPMLLNPTADALDGAALTLVEIDPATAETPEE